MRALFQAFYAHFFLLFAVVIPVVAFASDTPEQEFFKALEVDYRSTPYTTDLLGERLDLKTGSVSFMNMDVSVKGNSSIPVAIGRSFEVGGVVSRPSTKDGRPTLEVQDGKNRTKIRYND